MIPSAASLDSSQRVAELDLALEQVLARLDRPASVKQVHTALPKSLRRPDGELAERLDALVLARRVFAFPAGRGRKYTARDPEVVVRGAVLAALGPGPLGKKDLAARVKRAVPGLEATTGAVLATLLAEGAVREHPKAGKGQPQRFGLDPPDPGPFLGKVARDLQGVAAKLAPHGVVLAAVYAALGRALGMPRDAAPGSVTDEVHEDAAVLSAVGELAAREPSGALLAVRSVRALVRLDKARFDAAVLRLSAAGRVVLHHHDFPASLSDAERAGLVVDEYGTHYVGIAARRSP